MATIRDLFSALLPRVREAETEEDDPRPDPEQGERTFGIYRTTLHYQDGTTEEVEFYKVREDDDRYGFLQGFRDTYPDFGYVSATDPLKVPYAVLSRRPTWERVGTATVAYLHDPYEEDARAFESGVEITRVVEDYESGPRSGDKSSVEEDVDP